MATKVRVFWVSNRSILRVTPKEPFKAWAVVDQRLFFGENYLLQTV
jgi:hypothetical protein